MSIRINGAIITNHDAYWALNLVAENPRAFGIDPATLHVRGVQEIPSDGLPGGWAPEVNFTTAQVLQILNPHRPGQRSIDWADLETRAGQCDGLGYSHFAGLAQEFSRRFPVALRSARISIHSDIVNFRLTLTPRSIDPNSHESHRAYEHRRETMVRSYGLGRPRCP